MRRYEWNALRVGDGVIFHDVGTELALLVGTVEMVKTTRGRSANDVGIRVPAAEGGHRVVWPSHLAAHRGPPDPTEDCWRCAAIAETAARRLAVTGAAAVRDRVVLEP